MGKSPDHVRVIFNVLLKLSKIKRSWSAECNSGAFTFHNPQSRRWRHTEINVAAECDVAGRASRYPEEAVPQRK